MALLRFNVRCRIFSFGIISAIIMAFIGIPIHPSIELYASPNNINDQSRTDNNADSKSIAKIEDVIVRIKPVEGWKRGSLATVQDTSKSTIDESKIVVPSGWNMTEKSGKTILTPKYISSQEHVFAAMVISAYPSEYPTINSSANIAIEMYKNELKDFSLTSIKTTTMGNEPAVILNFNYLDDELGNTTVIETGTIHGDNEFLVQYFASDKIFSENIPLFMNVVRSISFKS
jgi:hypothetical protein